MFSIKVKSLHDYDHGNDHDYGNDHDRDHAYHVHDVCDDHVLGVLINDCVYSQTHDCVYVYCRLSYILFLACLLRISNIWQSFLLIIILKNIHSIIFEYCWHRFQG